MRAACIPSLILLAASSVASAQTAEPAPSPEQALSVGQREPFAFLLGTPTGEGGRTSSSEIIRVVSDLLRDRTNLELELLDAGLMRECRGRLACLALKARRDYERKDLMRPDGRPVPFREHVRAMREAGRSYPKYLFVLSNVTLSGQADRMSAVLVNTDLALAYHHEADRDAPDWEDAAEAKINVAAVVTAPARAQVAGPSEARAFLEQLFEERFRGAFDATGNWEPYGGVVLEGALPEAVVYLDDQPLGSARADATRIERVDPGLRRIRLEHPDTKPFVQEVRVRRGEVARVSVSLEAKPKVVSDVPRQVTLWTGAALFAAGVGISVYGATRPQAGLRTACIEGGEAVCEGGSRFITFGYDPDQASQNPRQINPPGVMIVPLGYSLAGAGAAFGIGALLSDEEDLPWIPWVAGLAVGALAYGVSAAVAAP